MRGHVDRALPGARVGRAIVLRQRVLGQQDQRIEHVLAVDLDDLELRQQELGERQRRARLREPVGELEPVAHLEAVHEDVDRPVARDVDEVGLLAAEQGVVPLVRRVALVGQELVERAAVLAARREVEVDLDAPGPRRPVRSVGADGHAAHQPDEEAALVGEIHDAQGLGQGVRERSRVAGFARVSGQGPSLQPCACGGQAPMEREYRWAVRCGRVRFAADVRIA